MTTPGRAEVDGPGWPDLLDALEERNRRCAGGLRGASPLPPEPALRADGPLPAGLRLRAELVLAETRRLEQLALARTAALRRARHYGAT